MPLSPEAIGRELCRDYADLGWSEVLATAHRYGYDGQEYRPGDMLRYFTKVINLIEEGTLQPWSRD